MWYDVIFFLISNWALMEIFWHFGYFFQNLGTYFLNLLVTLHVRHLKSSLTVYQRNKILNMISKPLACSIRIKVILLSAKCFANKLFLFCISKSKNQNLRFWIFLCSKLLWKELVPFQQVSMKNWNHFNKKKLFLIFSYFFKTTLTKIQVVIQKNLLTSTIL